MRFKEYHTLVSHSYPLAWAWSTGYSVLAVGIASLLVVSLEPAAASGGVPDVMAYINGVRLPSLTRWRLLLVKLISCGFAVGSGLPVGPEGPVIHIGSLP